MDNLFEKITKFLQKNKSYIIFWTLTVFIFIFVNIYTAGIVSNIEGTVDESQITYNEFRKMVLDNQVQTATIDLTAEKFVFTTVDGKELTTNNPKLTNFKDYLLRNNVEVTEVSSANNTAFFEVLRMGLTLGLLIMLLRNMMPKTQSRVQEVSAKKITFDDIAGQAELKKDMQFIVEFLKDPSKMERSGARMPSGVVLYGPPGTGKTLMAKAIAGTADVPFFSVSGSDFVEMFVGLGAKRVRELYEKAKKQAPCIVFIDEIDAVGGKRGTNNNSEMDQTLNALLTELDGFSGNEGIVTICATNRLENLDPALIRAGRFDKHLAVSLPDKKDRLAILKVHSNGKKFDDTVDFEDLASSTNGFAGADLASLLNEAAIIAATKNKEIISNEEVESAFFKIVMKGDKKENQEGRDKEELKLVAWHEAGHTLVGKLITEDDISKVTILSSTSGAGGVTFRNPKDSQLQSKEYLEKTIKMMYGGRAAEELLYNGDKNKVTTGASQDIKQATHLIKNYIQNFGMTEEFGMINIEEFMTNEQGISLGTNEKLLKEACKISNNLYKETLELLTENKELLKIFAEELLDKETLKSEEIDNIINNYKNKKNNNHEEKGDF